MSVDIGEVSSFLLATPPFTHLTPLEVGELLDAATISYTRAGERLPADTSSLHIVRTGAVDATTTDGILIDRLGPGEIYPRRFFDHNDITVAYTCYEDTLLISIPTAVIDELAALHPEIRTFVATPATRRKFDTRSLREATGTGGVATITALRDTVGPLARPAVLVHPNTPIQQVAQGMVAQGLSSALVVEPGEGTPHLLGIVTDSDLRTRVVAAGLPADTPVHTVMSPQPPHVTATTPIFEAMLMLSRADIHHLPVVDDNSIGVVTVSEMMRQLQADPIFAIEGFRSASEDDLPARRAGHTDVVVRFIDRGASPIEATQLVTLGFDELMARVHELTVQSLEQRIGPAPAAFCLIAMGSAGRGEMLLTSDQDHALIVADGADPHDPWFAAYGEEVSRLAEAAGIPRCPGGMMASNPRWRLNVQGWEHEFATWTQDLGQRNIMHAQTFFDMRAIAGDASLCRRVLDAAHLAGRKDRRFTNALVSLARRREPPLGFFRGFVLEKTGDYARTLDLKRGGLSAVVQLARLYAITARETQALGTRDRLRAAAQEGVISARSADDLIDAFDVFQMITLAHQAEQYRSGEEPDCRIAPESLGHVERESLRDAFRLVRGELRTAGSGH